MAKAKVKARTSSDLASEIESTEAKREGLIEDQRNLKSRIASLQRDVKELTSQAKHDPKAALKLESAQHDLESAQASEKSIAEEFDQVESQLRTLRASHRDAQIAETEAARKDALRSFLESRRDSMDKYQQAAARGQEADQHRRELFRHESKLAELGQPIIRFALPTTGDDDLRRIIADKLAELGNGHA